ncbi:actin cortical patch SUR7/pH-response regulator pali [Phakopsora pachyrhizi]|uniref:Actin cortical patch SUR7/pH-response regulator pali n=1 Tax=Phakopsora pachyrhizi TaxID=170000 RepID=A0AAV0BET8_PHAPC|nr:actin cortical patch SUR7/pH-response regulator pali [Phakopsora pachyrhizi]
MAGGAAVLAMNLTLAAGILYIFFSIGNFTIHQVVPRHIRIVTITTFGFGSRLNGGGDPGLIYGNSLQPRNERQPGDGLRLYYTWGLWNRCGGYFKPSEPQYCTETNWSFRFRPTEAILEDIPVAAQSRARSLLIDNNSDEIKSDKYLGTWSRIAFYFIFISIAIVALMLIISVSNSRSAGRLTFLSMTILNFLAFLSGLIGAAIWTGIVGVLKAKLRHDELGLRARFGNAIWILWGINGILLISLFPYLGVSSYFFVDI